MPLRTITLNDGTERTRNITDLHPDGVKFLPEEFALSGDTEKTARIYSALERLMNSAEKKE